METDAGKSGLEDGHASRENEVVLVGPLKIGGGVQETFLVARAQEQKKKQLGDIIVTSRLFVDIIL